MQGIEKATLFRNFFLFAYEKSKFLKIACGSVLTFYYRSVPL